MPARRSQSSAQRPRLGRGHAPRFQRPLRGPLGQLAAKLGLPGVEHPGGFADRLRGVLGRALSPVPRLAPRRGRLFSQAAVKARGDGPEPGHRVGGDRVERVLDAPAADLVLAERLQQGGPLGVLPVPLVLAGADPLPDHLVYLRYDVEPPVRLGQLQEVAGVRGVVLRGLHLLERGPLRLVLLQHLGHDCFPRARAGGRWAGPAWPGGLPGRLGVSPGGAARRAAGSPRRCRPPARPGSAAPGPAPR